MNVSESRYERDCSVPAVKIHSYRGLRRRFRRGEQPTVETPTMPDLEKVWEALYQKPPDLGDRIPRTSTASSLTQQREELLQRSGSAVTTAVQAVSN